MGLLAGQSGLRKHSGRGRDKERFQKSARGDDRKSDVEDQGMKDSDEKTNVDVAIQITDETTPQKSPPRERSRSQSSDVSNERVQRSSATDRDARDPSETQPLLSASPEPDKIVQKLDDGFTTTWTKAPTSSNSSSPAKLAVLDTRAIKPALKGTHSSGDERPSISRKSSSESQSSQSMMGVSSKRVKIDESCKDRRKSVSSTDSGSSLDQGKKPGTKWKPKKLKHRPAFLAGIGSITNAMRLGHHKFGHRKDHNLNEGKDCRTSDSDSGAASTPPPNSAKLKKQEVPLQNLTKQSDGEDEHILIAKGGGSKNVDTNAAVISANTVKDSSAGESGIEHSTESGDHFIFPEGPQNDANGNSVVAAQSEPIAYHKKQSAANPTDDKPLLDLNESACAVDQSSPAQSISNDNKASNIDAHSQAPMQSGKDKEAGGVPELNTASPKIDPLPSQTNVPDANGTEAGAAEQSEASKDGDRIVII
ncbi:uncharacterized protein [Amphiura filiformis]|uniref:uncharacterized protein n=1 Tax=Amphiura filiformis TaxID=82378 RepID=UPI003B20C76C